MTEYRERLLKAIATLEDMHANVKPFGHPYDGDMNAHFEKQRILAKIQGVKLALSYYDEMER